jgi:uncharacterized damage-inducible protein DinB
MNGEILYSEVKRAFPKLDNKAVHAFCKGLWSLILKWHKTCLREAETSIKAEWEKQAKATSTASGKRMTDEERADAVGDFLDARLLSGEITAAEIAQLKDIQNLKQKDRDVIIQVVSYKELLD